MRMADQVYAHKSGLPKGVRLQLNLQAIVHFPFLVPKRALQVP